MFDLYNYSLPTIFLIGLGAILVAIELGHWLGVRGGGETAGNVSTLEGAVIGLLALILGFTFAMSLSRFETRRDAILTEANAIGTTALRARLLPEAHRKEVLGLLRDYVNVRLDITQRPATQADLRQQLKSQTRFKKSYGSKQLQWRRPTTPWCPPVFSFRR